MATAAIFTLITNDGKQDRMLMATALLHQRLCAIRSIRAQNPNIVDPTPTLYDIEKTHVVFTNAHFKPFAAIGFEYNKQRANSGTVALGSEITFSIQQFGDFFAGMALHVTMTGPTLTLGGVTTTVPSDHPLHRWCSWVGERLVKTASFDVNANPLDDYTSTDMNFYRELFVPAWKLDAYARCMGQELEQRGWYQQPNWARNGVVHTAITSRVTGGVLNGLQTPRTLPTTGETIELFIPLNFWFNNDPRLAVPSVAIPSGQRYLKILLAEQSELVDLVPRGAGTFASPGGTMSSAAITNLSVELYVNNIFVNPEVHDIYIRRVGFSLIRVHRRQKILANAATAEVLLQQLKWPVEYLMVGMKVRAYSEVSGTDRRTNLDKWHRFTSITETNYTQQGVDCDRLERVEDNTGVAVTLLTLLADGTITFTGTPSPAFVAGDVISIRGVRFIMNTTGQVHTVSTAAVTTQLVGSQVYKVALSTVLTRPTAGLQVVVPVEALTIDSLTIKAHGINIYNDFECGFFNSYVPLSYGGTNVMAPKDKGVMLIPFCLYPGSYQPSGHINISRAREFFLEYVSSVITSSTEGSLNVSASCINFLLISDGSAVLRYST